MINFVISSANNEADMLRAVQENTARGLPLPEWGSKSSSISVCGNGPSLRDVQPTEGPIAALNGAWKTLVKSGIMPDYIIAHDPCAENIRWFDDAPSEPVYLLSSRVHPAVFEKLRGKKIQLWHIQDKPEASTGAKQLIGGGFTIGCQSLNLLNLIGFDRFELYGYDSCYSFDGQHHSTDQSWNITPPKPYQVGERMFIAETWMAAQVQEFVKQIEVNRFNYSVRIHGDGMLKAALDHVTLEVLYDLDIAPGSFDFFSSMINVENYRKDNYYRRVVVNFKPGSDRGFRPCEVIEIDHAYKKLMLNNVVRPLLKMFAFEEVESVSDKAAQFHYVPKESVDLYRRYGYMATYRESKEAAEWAKQFDSPYVITLREAEHWPQRNSNLNEWIKFAKTLSGRVIFVRDTVKAHELVDGFEICPEASIDIHKRFALYKRAKMNFAVTTGPTLLMNFDPEVPYIQFFTPSPGYHCYEKEWVKRVMGIEDERFPWQGPQQKLVWADDTAENISKVWNELQAA